VTLESKVALLGIVDEIKLIVALNQDGVPGNAALDKKSEVKHEKLQG